MSAVNAIVSAKGFRASVAQEILDALRGAGYAVLELPKPTTVPRGWRDDCRGCWATGLPYTHDSGMPVAAWPDGLGVSLPNGDFVTAEEARTFGLALLAAAADATELADA